MSPDDQSLDDHEWEVGWDGHERAQRRRMARLTLRQKVEWLEEAQKIAERLQASRERRKNPPDS